MSETRRLINETRLIPKKEKGQNFLTDVDTADRQIEYAGISRDDRVLEVGPGFGILTKRLVDVSDSVTCIELDNKLADYIGKEFKDGLTLIHGDALKVEWPEFDVFVSNLPYSVSTPIIFKLLEHDFRRAVVMVQKEFADRMDAVPNTKDYSRLTIGIYHKADCEIIETVSASRFDPRPKVDSAIVTLTPRAPPYSLEDERLFFKIVDLCFTHRRKKIGTSLKNARIIEKDAELPYLDNRIEDLSPEMIAELSNCVHSYTTNVKCRREDTGSI
ncbi:MAG TPA: 16S rRNA (adenine(1518)-N(6)/adenine(1519)-N(6))-dimethyltransferase RsmA [Candidatus Methanomethylophilaceae archaeon]|nr:16S rRNA (adenine(1518)-N(6)/adenine(1519)-N(6))-dimethyltransferase RsmA [Candidatus Methanomethylophilaceae archaeon]